MKHPNHKFKTYYRIFRMTKSQFKNIDRIMACVQNNGTKNDKINEIINFIDKRFREARNQFLAVHDRDLQRWCRTKAQELKFNFKASPSFILKLKKKLRISSRKSKKFISMKAIKNRETLEKNAQEFRLKIKTLQKNYSNENILNSDQIGFQKEIPPTRTLSYTNEKETLVAIQSSNNCTHSVTVQPTISLDGSLIGKLLICLQETNGEFGPLIKQKVLNSLEEYKNIHVICTKSGKMTNYTIRNWVKNCIEDSYSRGIIPESPTEVLLLLDNFSAHKHQKFDEAFDENIIKIRREFIPSGTTCIAQPLDTYFNHDLKYFIKTFDNRIRLDGLDIDIGNRFTLMRIFSLLWDQLSSGCFKEMILYSWYSSGYSEEYLKFKNMKEICFESETNDCDIQSCTESFFIKCSHCRKNLCLNHFYIYYHVSWGANCN